MLAGLVPHTLRPVPGADENYLLANVQCCRVEVAGEVVWDYSIFGEASEEMLVKKALGGLLDKNEEAKLLELIKNDSELIGEWGLGPDAMPVLVETYTDLAYQILYCLNDNANVCGYIISFKSRYYTSVMMMQLSDNVKRLLLKLRETVEIPTIYIELLIAKEIERQLTALQSQVLNLLQNRIMM